MKLDRLGESRSYGHNYNLIVMVANYAPREIKVADAKNRKEINNNRGDVNFAYRCSARVYLSVLTTVVVPMIGVMDLDTFDKPERSG